MLWIYQQVRKGKRQHDKCEGSEITSAGAQPFSREKRV